MAALSPDIQSLLNSARPFLRGELETVDPNLPSFVSALCAAGAGECWHKHGNFSSHLIETYRILKIWKSPDAVCICGMFHSAYSNSYVNLAIFPPSTGRPHLRRLIGEPAETLVHLFCVVPRQTLIHDDLLFHFSDQELVSALKESEISLKNCRELGVFETDCLNWRKKIQSLVPSEGVLVKHIKTGEEILISRRLVAVFLAMTMADFSDQWFGWQDELFENSNGKMEFSGNNFTALWPGNGKPGLWMSSISRMGVLYNLIVREEEIFMAERDRDKKASNGVRITDRNEQNGSSNGCCNGGIEDRNEDIELVIPPVFENCTKVLDPEDQICARDLYWKVVNGGKGGLDQAEELLLKCVEKNPFVAEPHVVLGQVYLSTKRFEAAEREVEKGLKLMLEWGSSWDKRMSWEGWVAWTRALLMKAKERSWPQTSWGILNLGLVN